jgi:predicted outer membrane repeat protein
MQSGPATVKNCVITRNYVTNNAMGNIYMIAGSLVQNCIIEDNINDGNYGGGVYIKGGTIRNCLIINNTAKGGGGISMQNATMNCVISGCTIVSNHTSYYGGGIDGQTSITGNVENCIVYFNTCLNNPDRSNYYFSASEVTSFSNCCLAPALSGNVTNYSVNNITFNPQLIAPASGNYRLNQSSPCVNAGVNRDWMNVDLDGHHRIDKFNGIVDMGCFEYLPSGSMYGFR